MKACRHGLLAKAKTQTAKRVELMSSLILRFLSEATVQRSETLACQAVELQTQGKATSKAHGLYVDECACFFYVTFILYHNF